MEKLKIFFAGSIIDDQESKKRYYHIIDEIKKFGTVLNEYIGDSNPQINGKTLSDEDIYSRDMKWLDEADVVIAEVSAPSLGVGYEIGHIERDKPILCLYQFHLDRRLSVIIAGNNKISKQRYYSFAEIHIAIASFLRKNNLI